MKPKKQDAGFTLIELIMVIVLIGIVAATAVMVIGNIIKQQQFDATVKEMNELKMAALGNPDLVQSGARSSFGYVGDMGALPTGNTLQPLVFMTTPPPWVATSAYHAAAFPTEPTMPDLGTGAGWRGPYIDDKKDSSGTYLATLDGWGNAYTTAGYSVTGQVTSTGGGAGNITIPETSVAGKITGSVTGIVRGNQGTIVQGAVVRIYFPVGGSLTTQEQVTNAGGAYSFNNIPIGRRTMRVISGTSPGWAIVDDTVVVEGGGSQTKDFVIADMIPPNPPNWANITGNCTVIGAYPFKTNQINLQWIKSTSPDTSGYRIYRGTASGGETLYQWVQGGASTSFIDNAITSNQTFYYKITAVDAAGNESNPAQTGNTPPGAALPGEVGAVIGGPIYKRANSQWRNNQIGNGNNDTLRFRTTNSIDPGTGDNYGLNNISMAAGYQMKVTWTGGAATSVGRVQVGGTTVYNPGCPGAGSGAAFNTTASYTYNCNGNQNIDISFCCPGNNCTNNNTMTSATAELNATPFDGVLNCTGGPPCQ